MKKACILLPLFLFSFGLSQAQWNMTLSDSIFYQGGLICNDVWGYVDSSGNEYAIFGTIVGEVIVDVSDPTNINQLFFTFGQFSLWRDFKVFGDYAYVSNESGDGLRIYDLSGLPGSMTFKDTVIQGVNTIHNLWIDDSGYLYAVGLDQFNGGAMILDLNQDPWNPSFVGSYDETYVHDIYVRGDLGYSAEIYDGLLTILDLSDRSDPQILGTTDYLNSFTHNTWLNDAGDVVFTTDELDAAYIYSWDISDPSNIVQLGSFRSPLSNGQAAPHNVHVIDDYLVISYYKDGIVVVDASKPESMVMVGYYDTSPQSGGGLDGAWGAYPFLPSGIVLATDMSDGFYVLQPDYQRAGHVKGTVTDLITNDPLAEVSVSIQPADESRMTNLSGGWSYGTGDYTDYKVYFSKYGYEPDSLSFGLAAGSDLDLPLTLTPTPRLDLTINVVEAGTLAPISEAQISLTPDSGDVFFEFLADLDGEYQAQSFVANSYELVVGKWGYQTKGMSVDLFPGTQTITVELEKGFYDDFALDFGWDISTEGFISWERAIPVGTENMGTAIAPAADLTTDVSNWAFVTGNIIGSAEAGDLDNYSTTLTSPIMDLSSYADPMLQFHYWLVNLDPTSGNAGNGSLKVNLVNQFTTIEIGSYDSALENDWQLVDSIHLNAFFPLSFPLQVQFVAKGGFVLQLMEAGIDGFSVLDMQPSTAVADLLDAQQFEVFPVPTSSQLTLKYDLAELAGQENLRFDLLDLQGRLLQQVSLSQSAGQVEIETPYAAGLYISQLRSDQGILAQRKILIAK